MFSDNYLALRRVRLKGTEKWASEPNHMVFVFLKSGRGQYISRSGSHILSPGDVLVLNASNEGEMRPEKGGEFSFCFFSVCPEHVFPLFSSSEISLLRNVAEGFKGTKLHSFDTVLAQKCHRLVDEAPPLGSLEHRGQLLRVAAAILGAEANAVQPNLPGFVRAEDHLLQVFEKVSADELLNSSVGELAVKFGWSKRHLNRMFHSYFGLSAAAMKMEMRLLRAVSLLRDPDVKIISVAEICGFNYLGFFNTCFKKRFGVTPSQRRKMMAEEGQPVRPGDQGNDHVCPLRSLGMACRWSGSADNEKRLELSRAEMKKGGAKVLITAAPSGSSQPPAKVNGVQNEPEITAPKTAWRERIAYGARALTLVSISLFESFCGCEW